MKIQEDKYDAKVKLNLWNLHLQFCQIDSAYNIAVTGFIDTPSWSMCNHMHTLSAVCITTMVSLSLSFTVYKVEK